MPNDRIGVIGVGKLGLCFALSAADAGFEVVAIDKREDLIRSLESGEFRSTEPGVNQLLAEWNPIAFTTDLDATSACQLLFVFVPTPSLPSGAYDHSAIDHVLEDLPSAEEPVKDLVICCTTMPGYVASRSSKAADKGYRLSYNPSFIAQGNVIQGIVEPDLILIGEASVDAGDSIVALYKKVCRPWVLCYRMSTMAAEVVKMALNCFLTMKIAYANSIGDLLYRIGCQDEIENALQAIGSDSRIGHKFLRYGDGYGGPCLPRDNVALQRAAQSVGVSLPLCEAADDANADHLMEQLHRLPEGPLVFRGVAYKEGTDIIEESQRLALAQLAVRVRKSHVKIVDSQAVIDQVRAIHGDLFEYEVG